MASNTKRLWKVQELQAHTANVNCLALGHKSGHVLVTGGDDKKVNLWAVGKSNCIMSLSGHTSAIDAVKFNQSEELVAAGSSAGVLKIWDLEAVKVVRTLTGHRGGLRGIDFHPYGDLITSSSLDSTVKVWDIRRKGCIFTYKGHSQSVNSVKFSPDGLWVASGGEEGLVKLWDVRAGRELHEFSDHSGPVTSVEFHPNEFLLTSASCDKTVNFYDLENFSLVSSSDRETMTIRCVCFNEEGSCLYGGGLDSLKVMAWEPSRTLEVVPINWGRVQDITVTVGFSNNLLVGASFQLSNVSLWMVDLTRVAPLGDSAPLPPSPFSYGQSVRKSFSKKPSPEKTPINVKTIEEVEKLETDPEDDHQAEIPDINDYRSVFQPRSSLNRSPPPSIVPPPVSDEDLSLPTILQPSVPPPSLVVEPPKTKSPTPLPPPSPRRRVPSPSLTPPAPARRETLRRLSSCKEPELSTSPDSDYPVRLNTGIQHSPSEPSLAPTRSSGHSRTSSVGTGRTYFQQQPVTRFTAARNTNKTEIINSQNRANNNSLSPTARSPVEEKQDLDFIPMSLDRPSGLNMEEFLPQRIQQAYPEMSEAEVHSSIMRGHEYIVNILKGRERQLQIIYHMWHNKDLKTAVDHALTLRDLSVIVDLLGVLILRPGIWNLDLCVALLPTIGELLQSKFEMYMTVGSDTLKLILHTFTPVIKSNVVSSGSAVGVDISKEERYKKCMKCYSSLVSIRAFLLKRQTMQGKLGHTFRELLILLQALDSH